MNSDKPAPVRPLWQRMLLSAGRTTLTLTIMAGALGAGVAGYGVLSARAAGQAGPVPAPATTVQTLPIRLQDTVTLPRQFTGLFEAAQVTRLGFEEGGTLAAILVREGDSVRKGQALARLDTRLLSSERDRLVASRAALEAQAELARRTNARQEKLRAAGHVSAQRVDETSLQLAQLTASLAEIDAALAVLDVRLDKAELRAPFAGRISARFVDTGAVAGAGSAVLSLVEDGPARFRVALDPDLAARLVPGARANVTGRNGTFDARLDELAPDLDPVTRSQLAYFVLSSDQALPPPGSTGTVTLEDTRAARGAWVPLSALRQGPRGAWTLLTVSEAGTVQIEAAEVLHLDTGRAYVRGSFAPDARFVPHGTHRVVPGERVRLAEVR